MKTMQARQYQKEAERTECNQLDSLNRLKQGGIPLTRILHSIIGLMGEVGEMASAFERHVYYGHELDVVNLKEELGDLMWRVAQQCNALGITIEQVCDSNTAKLRKRYPKQFDEKMALEENRDREAERKAVESPASAISFLSQDMRNRQTDSYERLCKECNTKHVHKTNKTQTCPDCAADIRAGRRKQQQQQQEEEEQPKQNGLGWAEPPEEKEG